MPFYFYSSKGTTSGTGFVAARTVLENGGELVALNRKSQRVTDATAKLQEAVPSGQITNIECDLQDFASVRKAAKEVKSMYKKIYCLSCNAGISHTEDKPTKDGCCNQMQTNHLSHFILAAELHPLLEAEAAASGDARCVFHSSGARATCEKKFLEQRYFEKNGGNLGDEGNSMLFATLIGGGKSFRYSQSKLANSVMMYAMHEKLEAKGSKVKVCCAHPGFSATSLGNSIVLPWFERLLFNFVLVPMSQSAEDGTMGLLTGMMADDAKSGVLYGPMANGSIAGPAVPNPPQPHEYDPESIKMLWKTSEETTGVMFDI